MNKKTALFLASIMMAVPAFSQTLFWKNYSSMYDVNGVTVSGGRVWAATGGGVFSYSPVNGEFREYTTTDGLSNIQATAIASDSGSFVLVGEADGSVDEIDSTGKVVRSQRDISKSSAISKQVSSLSVVGDTIFACTPFGVVLFSRSTFGTLDTYSHFDPAQGSISANGVAVFSGKIFVASQMGLSYAPRSAINLSAPDLWQLMDSLNFGRGINAVTVFDGTLLVGTQQGVYYSNDGISFQEYANSPNAAVYGFAPTSNYVLVNTASGLYKMNSAGSFTQIYGGGTTLDDVAPFSDTLAVAGTNQGLLTVGTSANAVVPPGPATNVISDLAIDSSGNLWCSTARTVEVGVAFMKFDGTVWKNFSMYNNSHLFTDNYYRMSAVGGDRIVAGAWGGPSASLRGGVAFINGDSIQVYSSANSSLVGEPDDATYVLGGSAEADASGNIWIANPLAYTNNPLAVYSPSKNKWYSFHNGYSTVSGFSSLAIDAYGGVWTGDGYGQAAGSGSYSGLFYYNANGTLDNTADDESGIFTANNASLLSDHITALRVDNEGYLWIGTDLGLDVIYDPDPQGNFYVQSIYSLLDQNINSIDYDALDQKWVATNTGVYVISKDGNTPVASYNSTNSPLPSNEVLAIACDRKNGIVYMSTQYGITELRTGVVQPSQNFAKLKIYPDPAVLPLPPSQTIHIEGLVANSEIKVFTIDGQLVDQFAAQGGDVAYWSGTDQTGKILPSGIYILVAYSPDGSQSTVAKIAVIHR